MRTILYVCTGNTCRSPMAEAITRHWLASGELGEPGDVFVASAGIMAADGSPTTPETNNALREMGIEHDGRSKPLTAEMIAKADLVLCMTESHRAAVAMLAEAAGGDVGHVQRLDPERDLDDPIGMGQEVYDALASRLMTLIPQRLKEVFVS